MRSRPTTSILFVIALVAGAAIGSASSCVQRKRPRCLPSNCEGCCEGETCITLGQQSHEVCGFLGSTCRACSATQLCQNGYCLSYYDGGTIGPFPECGLRGEECCVGTSGCYFGLYCSNGSCVNTVPPGGDDAGTNGGLPVGSACSLPTECHYGDCAGDPYTGGYCTKTCNVSADCPAGTTCALDRRDFSGLSRACAVSCALPGVTDAGCRAGYVCDHRMTALDQSAVCTPACTGPESCDFYADCDSRGFCCGKPGYACCDGTGCDGGGSCLGGYCREQGATNATGAPCTDSAACLGGRCVVEVPAGEDTCFIEPCWPAGYCSQLCGADTCAAGSTCASQRSPEGQPYCLENCTFDGGQGSCRTGYVCDRNWAMGTSQPVCMYKCGEPAECPNLTSCQDGFCCGAKTYRCCGGVGGTCSGGGTCNAEGYCE